MHGFYITAACDRIEPLLAQSLCRAVFLSLHSFATKEKKSNKFKIASIVITTIIALVMVGGFAYICSTAIEITGDHPEVIGYLVLFGAIFAACLIVAFVQLFKRNR